MSRCRFRYQSENTDEAMQPRNAADDAPADFWGRPMQASWYRRGGVLRLCVREFEFLPDTNKLATVEKSHLPELRRQRDLTMLRYRQEERCTNVELRTMRALWIEGLSLREFARREGVKAQAISARINGLANKAPEFYRWWRRKHFCHQR